MPVFTERPRELRWYHAAGMLFGDWGTSRLYVMGLAFVMSLHASFWYVAAICVLMAVVGFSYTIICAHFPDGGGVYSAAKHRSRSLAVVGALLLIVDYIVTAALSAYEGFRYILPNDVDPGYAMYAAVLSIVAIGVINVFGPRRAGFLALVVALASVVFYLIIGGFCLAKSGHAVIERPHESFGLQWNHFVNVILALSGVEAIANMTGIMGEPVAKNARKAIFVVLLEVVTLNLVIAYAMNALPDSFLAGESFVDKQDHMVKLVATYYVGPRFAAVSAFFFGLLLVSAANTAISDMISIQYLMGRDKELPDALTSLNSFGVPWLALIGATAAPAAVLLVIGAHMEVLAGMYAIGVVGAITINLLACGSNLKLTLAKWERGTLLAVGGVVGCIGVTVAVDKPAARNFALIVLATGLLARYAAQRARMRVPAVAPAAAVAELSGAAALMHERIPPSMPRVLAPLRGNPKLFQFAVGYAKDKKAALFVLFVREVALAFKERGGPLATSRVTLAHDKEAQKVFADVRKLCEEAGVPLVPLYAVHDSPAEVILDHAATLGVDALLMGVSKRGALWKTLRGDVLQEVINYLPQSIPLLIHA
ncbi:MAG: amino acid permease [Planctomycetota bacterium]|nr:amino acid permease [Planctomycetota bacterium]